MNQLVARLAGVISNDIHVSGLPSQEYPELMWRGAILFFLFEVWSNRQSVIARRSASAFSFYEFERTKNLPPRLKFVRISVIRTSTKKNLP